VIAYLDSSVLLRVIVGQPDRLSEWHEIERGVVSALVEVECLRALDGLRLRGWFSDEDLTRMREAIFRYLDSFEVVQVREPVLARAAQPMPVVMGTLDAIHLATALLWRDAVGEEPVMATHDRTLALAARAFGLEVVGAV
jgi:predicted nucleic acid-binding protein